MQRLKNKIMDNELKQIILDAHLGDGQISIDLVKEKNTFNLGLTDKHGNLTREGDRVARNYAQEKHPEWKK